MDFCLLRLPELHQLRICRVAKVLTLRLLVLAQLPAARISTPCYFLLTDPWTVTGWQLHATFQPQI